MKKLLILLLLPLISGCVTYYTPEAVIEDGVYYADEDPAYINNAYVSGSYIYVGAAYYPWRSMDYFYLGYRSYGYGYSPWYSPYYSYYSPWYRPRHHYAYGHHWRRHGGYCQPYNVCGRSHYGNSGGKDHDRYADNDREDLTDRRNREGEDEDGNENLDNRHNDNDTGSYGTSPVSRYVSTAPSGYSGNQGMVIRSRETTKTGKHRVDPAKTEPITVTDLATSNVSVTQPVYRSRQDGREIRYRSSPKQGRARTGPVDSRPASGSGIVAVAPTPVHTNYRSRQASGEIRYSAGAKQGKSRTDPVRSASPYREVSAAAISPGTTGVPVQRSRNSQPVNAGTTRHVAGKSSSDTSSRSTTRSRSNAPVSHSSRSSPASSSSSSRGSIRNNSEDTRRQN